MIADPNASAPRTAQQWFQTAAFTMPSPFTFGNAGRNIVFGDNDFSIDAAVHKETMIGERVRVQCRAEAFNLLNNTNFADAPGRIAFTATFGHYTSAQNSRQLQFALKVLF